MSRLSEPQFHRWPRVRKSGDCPLCGQPKAPGMPMCLTCFTREHMGKGQYSRETVNRLRSADAAMADADPWGELLDALEG